MEGRSFLGTGLMTLSIRPHEDGLCEITLWVTLLFLPVFPLTRWKVEYFGEAMTEYPHQDSAFRFGKIEQLPLKPGDLLKTYLLAIIGVAIAVGPAIALTLWLPRPPNPFQIAVLIASSGLPAVVIEGRNRWQRRVLTSCQLARHEILRAAAIRSDIR